MSDRVIIRGDDYVLRRAVFVLTLVDDELQPFDMSGSTIRSTFKPNAIPPDQDPDDESAELKCFITFNSTGDVAGSDGLRLPDDHDATEGVLWLTADREATLNLPLGTKLQSDVEIVDGNGEHLTVMSMWTLSAVDGITNRVED